MNETWKPIPGWEGIYEASSTGLIRSVPRWIVQRNRWRKQMRCWRNAVVLRQTANDKGYLGVPLRGGGRRQTGHVHQLVALAFLGPCPVGLEVCHGNDDKSDNRVENLRYDTHSENTFDAIRNGTKAVGSRHYKYRLDIDEAEVLRLRAEGWSYRRLGRDLGIGSGTVSRIIAGERLRQTKRADTSRAMSAR